MSGAVQALLQAVSQGKPGVSVLEAIMGEDWAQFKAGNPRKALHLQYMVSQQRTRQSAGAGLAFRVGRRTPQALVKMISAGGAKDAKGLRAQMEYLRKDGTVELQRSERHFGIEIDEEEQGRIEASWGLSGSKVTGADKTSHFVVSFPIGTDRDAAARAGRAWAEEMFGAGRFDDRYDYYTADHRDTDHPHTHVVVARRGIEQGHWLKISRRSEMNYDVLREIQVEVAALEGIELEASPRLARGVHDLPPSPAEFWKVKQGLKLEPEAPAHTEESALVAAATVLAFSTQIEAEKKVLGLMSPEMDERLEAIVSTLRAGHQIEARKINSDTDLKELKVMSLQYVEKRAEIVQNFQDMDRDIKNIPDPTQRVALHRHVATLRREAALLLPDNKELQAYRQGGDEAAYQGLRGSGGGVGAEEVRRAAQVRVADIARQAGLDATELQARYGTEAVSKGLVRQWRALELTERSQTRSAAGLEPETRNQAVLAITGAHRQISLVYREAQSRLAEHGVSISEARREQEPRRNDAPPAENTQRTEDLEQVRRQQRARDEKKRDRGRGSRDDDGFGL